MYFEAQLDNKVFKLDVTETPSHWRVGLQPQNQEEWSYYSIPKEHFQKVDDAISFLFKNGSYVIDVVSTDTQYTLYTRGSYRSIRVYNDESLLHESLKASGAFSDEAQLISGMPGKILKILVEAGDEIEANQPLLVMEAMKMENELRAPKDVKIRQVKVKEGDTVETDTVLIVYEK